LQNSVSNSLGGTEHLAGEEKFWNVTAIDNRRKFAPAPQQTRQASTENPVAVNTCDVLDRTRWKQKTKTLQLNNNCKDDRNIFSTHKIPQSMQYPPPFTSLYIGVFRNAGSFARVPFTPLFCIETGDSGPKVFCLPTCHPAPILRKIKTVAYPATVQRNHYNHRRTRGTGRASVSAEGSTAYPSDASDQTLGLL
jgi:hypothetical protein